MSTTTSGRGPTALIGSTGYVGGTLQRDLGFDDLYNSSNIADIGGKHYDLVICAGAPAVKWLANREPEQDRASLARLTSALQSVSAREFILISTIDVYPEPQAGLDESADLAAVDNHAYGRHRLELERWVTEHFALSRVVRLPALFGQGLKKNAIFDLLHDNETHKINPAASFQWYPMRRLAGDLATVRAAGLDLVNLFTEPVPMSTIIGAFFSGAVVAAPSHPAPQYAARTRHAGVFGGRDGYMLGQTEVLGELARFVAGARS